MYNFNVPVHDVELIDLGNLSYDASTQCLSSNEGTIYLRSKLNEVFHYMVLNQEKLVSREELIQKVWYGNYYTGAKAVTHTVCKLRKTLNDLGESKVQIKTYPKRGYTLQIN